MGYKPLSAYDRQVEAERYEQEKAQERRNERLVKEGKAKWITRKLSNGVTIRYLAYNKRKEAK